MTDIDFEHFFDNPDARHWVDETVRDDACSVCLSPIYQAYYRFARPIMPLAVRQWIQRRKKVQFDPQWYLPQEFVNRLDCELNLSASDLADQLWPERASFSIGLTHDVETAEGIKNIARIADMEEELGFRSSWMFVPHKYQIDQGLIRDLKQRGFEIGIHGYNHDGKLFSSKKLFSKRIPAINQAIENFGASGFRSPMVHRNLGWQQELNIDYDTSCFDIDPFQASPGGVGMIWPFIAGKFVELPYTLPQDHTLFIRLGHQDDQVWRDKLEFLIRHHGMALMLTHPDYLGPRELDIYRGFLEHVKSHENFWHALPRDIAQWWRSRHASAAYPNCDAQERGPVSASAK